jgi:hypothetical protein
LPKQTLAEAELRQLARLGAVARLKEIEAEAAAIRSAFPGLVGAQPAKPRTPAKPTRRRRPMSAAAREAARTRMHEYWARKKAAQAAAPAAPGNGAADRATDAAPRKARKARGSRGRRAKKSR